MIFRPLTRAEFDAMPETGKARRRAHWQGIVRGLQAEHTRRYHSAANILALELTCTWDHCTGKALSVSGLCPQHAHKARGVA